MALFWPTEANQRPRIANGSMLAEAVCKLEGFRYALSDAVYWHHGHSTERDFIHVTTQSLGPEQLQQLSDDVGERLMKRKTPPVQTAASIYERIREILESAKTSVARSVNTTQVLANWLIGREIVEEEQRGNHRAGYGQTLVSDLSKRLREEYGKGYSAANLWLFRQFFATYPSLIAAEILYAPRRESGATANAGRRGSVGQASSGSPEIARAARRESSHQPSRDSVQSPPMEILCAARSEFTKGGVSAGPLDAGFADDWSPGHLHPNLSWTHYRTLLRVEKSEARAFYEIEALENRWSARELERQINSLLYERLALSKDKKGLMRLATKGQEIQQPIDIFKDPVVMEFLGLPESPRLVETDLEQELIDNLQTFLLELGKGFAFVSDVGIEHLPAIRQGLATVLFPIAQGLVLRFPYLMLFAGTKTRHGRLPGSSATAPVRPG
jgi:predicted nuclease of restriction endonuclease-like (RecB) superfamily